jgi:hypothetical protein
VSEEYAVDQQVWRAISLPRPHVNVILASGGSSARTAAAAAAKGLAPCPAANPMSRRQRLPRSTRVPRADRLARPRIKSPFQSPTLLRCSRISGRLSIKQPCATNRVARLVGLRRRFRSGRPVRSFAVSFLVWRWLVSSQAVGVFGPPVVCGPVGFVEPYLSRRWMALAPTLTYATS